MPPPSLVKSRREVLRAMFLGAAAASLGACGGGGSSSQGSTNVDTDNGDTPQPPILSPMPAATELPLSAGPLANIGTLIESDVDDIMIPEGFSIRRVARAGLSPTLNFTPWHSSPDGGAVFQGNDGGWVYVSNSESTPGGVGALRFDASGKIIDNYRILKDTRNNCAGGATPWQTWLSCEEIRDGQVYECDPFGSADAAVARPALGIFNHEAVAVDLPTRTLYLTEDAGDGRLYRYTALGQATSINGQQGLNLTNGLLEVLEIEGYENGGYQDVLTGARHLHKINWVEVVSPERPQADIRDEIAAAGGSAPGTVFKGGEGIWTQTFAEGRQVAGSEHPLRAVVFFACKGDNRVYALDVDNDLIEVVFDNEQLTAAGETPYDDVDNLVVSPAGDVIVAEDGDAMRLMVMVPNADAKILLQVPRGKSELTGPAFTADGSRLYFSSQRGPVNFGVPWFGTTYELTIPKDFH